MIINKRKSIDYSTLILFLGASGIPYISDSKINVLLFGLMVFIFFLRQKFLNKSFILFSTILFSITLLQAFKFDFISMITTMGLFTMVINAYLIIKILEDKFIPYYVNVLYYMAISSFVFYFMFLFFPSIGTFFLQTIVPVFSIFNISHSISETILVYNLSHIDLFRNSGPFWEPGAFAGYLILAYIFNFFKNPKMTDKKNMVFLIAILTTLSTTAFFALFLFLFFIYFKKIKNIIFKVGAVIIIITVSIYAYNTLDFLGKKIEEQLKVALEQGIQKSSNSQRFLNILRDINSLKGNEYLGRGGNNQTRFGVAPGEKFIIPTVGLTDVIVKYGIPFFLLLLFFLYRSVCTYAKHFNHEDKLYCIGIISAILTTLLSEVYFAYSMYWSLLFVQYAYYPRESHSYDK